MASDPLDVRESSAGPGEATARGWRGLWQRRLVRWATYLLALLVVAFGVFWLVFARDLPSVEKLKA
jgi:penicillin-binding protein 1A